MSSTRFSVVSILQHAVILFTAEVRPGQGVNHHILSRREHDSSAELHGD